MRFIKKLFKRKYKFCPSVCMCSDVYALDSFEKYTNMLEKAHGKKVKFCKFKRVDTYVEYVIYTLEEEE